MRAIAILRIALLIFGLAALLPLKNAEAQPGSGTVVLRACDAACKIATGAKRVGAAKSVAVVGIPSQPMPDDGFAASPVTAEQLTGRPRAVPLPMIAKAAPERVGARLERPPKTA